MQRLLLHASSGLDDFQKSYTFRIRLKYDPLIRIVTVAHPRVGIPLPCGFPMSVFPATEPSSKLIDLQRTNSDELPYDSVHPFLRLGQSHASMKDSSQSCILSCPGSFIFSNIYVCSICFAKPLRAIASFRRIVTLH